MCGDTVGVRLCSVQLCSEALVLRIGDVAAVSYVVCVCVPALGKL